MNAETLRLFFAYNTWANRLILDAAAKLTLEQFLTPAAFSHGGVRGTLCHVFNAEHIWRKRMQEGISPSAFIPETDFSDFESLRKTWDDEQAKMMGYVGSLNDGSLYKTFCYRNTKGVENEPILWQTLVHVVNHGTQHRAEAAILLTNYGYSPGDVDMIKFFLERMK